jgi:hypothetical protein
MTLQHRQPRTPAEETSQGHRRTLTSRTMDNKERKAYDAAIIDYKMNIDIMQERLKKKTFSVHNEIVR